jgi:thiamine-phosphate pyrophosphorylase
MRSAPVKDGIFRILDANLNRSREGLRVCEDVTRFMLNSASLSGELKALRHGIAAAAKAMPSRPKSLLESRDSGSDVGRSSRLATEMKRTGPADIFMANMQRVKESLRVLEEFAKLIDVKLAVKFRRLRFKAYDVEKKAAARLCP